METILEIIDFEKEEAKEILDEYLFDHNIKVDWCEAGAKRYYDDEENPHVKFTYKLFHDQEKEGKLKIKLQKT